MLLKLKAFRWQRLLIKDEKRCHKEHAYVWDVFLHRDGVEFVLYQFYTMNIKEWHQIYITYKCRLAI